MGMYWQPGQTIPITDPNRTTPQVFSPSTEDSSGVVDILQRFQTSMEKQLISIDGKLESGNGRMEKLEDRLTALEKEIKEKEIKDATPKRASSTPGRSRGRVTPTSLQVRSKELCTLLMLHI